jgi:hypothetical protein
MVGWWDAVCHDSVLSLFLTHYDSVLYLFLIHVMHHGCRKFLHYWHYFTLILLCGGYGSIADQSSSSSGLLQGGDV